MDQITQKKRKDLERFIQDVVVHEPAVRGIVVIGSVAKGVAREDSDIDAVIFLEPYDLYAVPAECKWLPEGNRFFGIFSHVENSIQLDFHRLPLGRWADPKFEWPETLKAELAEGMVVYDPAGVIGPMIEERTLYTADVQRDRIDEAVIHLDWLLGDQAVKQAWENLGSNLSNYRLHSAFDYVVQAIFAINGRWRTLPSREMVDLLACEWLPDRFEATLHLAMNTPSEQFADYEARVALLKKHSDDVVRYCVDLELYGDDPVGEAFIWQNEEPGRDWNMKEWVEGHHGRG